MVKSGTVLGTSVLVVRCAHAAVFRALHVKRVQPSQNDLLLERKADSLNEAQHWPSLVTCFLLRRESNLGSAT